MRGGLAALAACGLLIPAAAPGSAAAQTQAQTQAPATAALTPPWLTREALRAKYGDRRSRMTTIGGVEVNYQDEGAGPVILLVHGSISTLKTWDGVAARLVKNYRVIRYDIPPFGLSGSVPDAVLAKVQPVDIAEQLLTRLGVTKATVVGVSSGGTLAVQLAAKRPDLVQRVILSNAPSDPLAWSPPVDKATLQPAFVAAEAEEKRLGYRTRDFWKAWFGHYGGVPERFSPQFIEQIYDMNRRAPEPNVTGLIAKVADHDSAVAAMNAVTAPTLLLWGGADPMLPVAAMDKMGAYLTHAKLSKLVLEDVGHYPPMEDPERYAKLVRIYIETVSP